MNQPISEERIVNDVLRNWRDITCYDVMDAVGDFSKDFFWFESIYFDECIPRVIDYIKVKYDFNREEPLPQTLMDRLDTYFINKVRKEHPDAATADCTLEYED